MDDLTSLISTVGFPIAAYLMLRADFLGELRALRAEIKENTQATQALVVEIARSVLNKPTPPIAG